MSISLPQRVSRNVAGDFYVEAGFCTRCCLVHVEAPELMNDPDEPFEECFFRRQPETPEEIDRAIDAICVSEVCALRYGGTDRAIIEKLRKRHAASVCDHTPEGQAWLKRHNAVARYIQAKRDGPITVRQTLFAILAIAALTVFFEIMMRLFPQGG